MNARNRAEAPNIYLITRDDLLGPKPDNFKSPELNELHKKEGLLKVKLSVDSLISLLRTNAELEEQEKPLRNVCLNRIFIRNPGTGKTTVVKLYAMILKGCGLLSKGDVIIKTPQDFVGSVLGESENNTKAILDSAKGCVLMIDEAYGLGPSPGVKDPYRTAVIDTIVAEAQGVPGDE